MPVTPESPPTGASRLGGLRLGLGSASVLVNAGLFTAFLLLATPLYDTNDEVWLWIVASGAWTGSPSEYVVVSHVLIGWMLRLLYTGAPGLPWHPLYMYVVHYVSMVVLLVVLVRAGGARRGALAFAVLFGVFTLRTLLRLHFTTVSYAAIQSGLLVLLLAYMRHHRPPRAMVVGGVGLIVLGGLVREHTVYLILMLIAPVVGLHVWQARRPGLAIALGVALVVHVGLWQLHKAYYARDPAWSEHLAYTVARHSVVDMPGIRNVEPTDPLFAKVGLSENDVYMLRYRYINDLRVYSLDTLRALRRALPRYNPARVAYNQFLRVAVPFGLLLAFTAVHMGAALMVGNRLRRLMLAGLLVAVIGVSGAMCIAARLPPRVFLPMLYLVNTLAWFLMIVPREGDAGSGVPRFFAGGSMQRAVGVALALAYLGLVLHNGRRLLAMDRQHRVTQEAFRTLVAGIPAKETMAYVVWGADFPFQWVPPLSTYDLAALRMLILGWPDNGPAWSQVAARMGITDVTRALYERNDVQLLSNDDSVRALSRYVKEHYHRDIAATVVWRYHSPPGAAQADRYRDVRCYRIDLVDSPTASPSP